MHGYIDVVPQHQNEDLKQLIQRIQQICSTIPSSLGDSVSRNEMMMKWWWNDDEMMMKWNDEMMMKWWWNEMMKWNDEMMMKWWYDNEMIMKW